MGQKCSVVRAPFAPCPVAEDKRSFQPTCDTEFGIPAGYSCCVVNASSYSCPPLHDCTEKGCCVTKNPTECYPHWDQLSDGKWAEERSLLEDEEGEEEEEEGDEGEEYGAYEEYEDEEDEDE